MLLKMIHPNEPTNVLTANEKYSMMNGIGGKYMKASLENDIGLLKEVKVGFSWTTLFFGFFPALFRGDLKWAAIMFISSLAIGIITAGTAPWVISIAFAFVYNKIYIKELIEKGYRPAGEESKRKLESIGITLKST